MKKFLTMAIVAAMLTAALTGCSQNNGGADTTTEAATEATTEAATEATTEAATEATTEAATEDTTDGGETNADSKVQKILASIKEVYGEDYVPSMALDSEMLNGLLNITSDQYVDFAAEMPMISVQVDTVIILQAAEGQADALEAALNTYRDTLVNDSMQYPMNFAKVNASKVVRNGDYVAFLMLGKINDNMEVSEAEAAEYEEAQVQKAVDAFNGAF